jgi:hypothetical protein
MLFALTLVNAQTEPSGIMNATTESVFNYEKDGVKIPYTVIVQESRKYYANENASMAKVDQIALNAPAKVSKLIIIKNASDPMENRIISLKYDKQITDSFKLVSTDRGFAINVDNKTLEYIIGEGVYFTNTDDRDFFIVDVFDTIN